VDQFTTCKAEPLINHQVKSVEQSYWRRNLSWK